jgi:hypothetical protein
MWVYLFRSNFQINDIQSGNFDPRNIDIFKESSNK